MPLHLESEIPLLENKPFNHQVPELDLEYQSLQMHSGKIGSELHRKEETSF